MVIREEDWGRWIAQQEHAMSEPALASGDSSGGHASPQSFNLKALPAELRDIIWDLAIRDALNEAARSLPDEMVRELGFAVEGYHGSGCRCHSFWRNLRPFLGTCKESRAAVSRYTKQSMADAGNGEDGDIV